MERSVNSSFVLGNRTAATSAPFPSAAKQLLNTRWSHTTPARVRWNFSPVSGAVSVSSNSAPHQTRSATSAAPVFFASGWSSAAVAKLKRATTHAPASRNASRVISYPPAKALASRKRRTSRLLSHQLLAVAFLQVELPHLHRLRRGRVPLPLQSRPPA